MHAGGLRDPHSPQADGLRALPGRLAWLQRAGRELGATTSLCSVLVTPHYLPSDLVRTSPRRGGKGCSTGLPVSPANLASPPVGADRYFPVEGGDQKARLQGSPGQAVRRLGDSIGASSLSPPAVNRLWPVPGGQGARRSPGFCLCIYLFIYYTY